MCEHASDLIVGPLRPESVEPNGESLISMCVRQQLHMVNTWWSRSATAYTPLLISGHRIDYVLLSARYASEVRWCATETTWGQFLQIGAQMDHVPVCMEMTLRPRSIVHRRTSENR
eukprot:5105825-Heterocapsa_arctica.AAC.1